MIKILETRNITVSDKEFAVQALSNFSYYSIVNGYKNTFLNKPNTDEFVSGTKFEDLYSLNLIDADLNNIIFKYILHIEKSLKSKLSYRVSEQFGIFTARDISCCPDENDYLHKSHYSNSTGMRMNTLNKIRKCIEENKNRDVIKHYIAEKNHLPSWILTYVVPFGLTINWYRILKRDDKDYICNLFIPNQSIDMEQRKEFLIKSFELLKKYRNAIAHGGRTLGLSDLPPLPKNQTTFLADNLLSEDEYRCGRGQCDTYSVFIIILILLNDATLLREFYFDLYVFFHKYREHTFNNKSIYKVFDLPNDALNRMHEYLIKKLSM